MKRVFVILVLVFSSFFLSSSFVSADEYNLTIKSNYNLKSYIEEILPIALNTIDEYFIANPTYFNSSTRFWLSFNPNNGSMYAFTFRDEALPSYISWSGSIYEINYNNPRFKLTFSSDYLSIIDRGSNSTNKTTVGATSVLYSNFPLAFRYSSNGKVINFNYNDLTYSVIDSSETFFPTVYDLYNIWYGVHEPEDNTPMLTTFYSTIINKIGDFATSLSGNYIYLSIFGIFILLFLIELIRRYLI